MGFSNKSLYRNILFSKRLRHGYVLWIRLGKRIVSHVFRIFCKYRKFSAITQTKNRLHVLV
jgi:hypothetical protein